MLENYSRIKPTTITLSQTVEREVTCNEVKKALVDLKRWKRPSHDNITNEHIIYGKTPI